MQIPTTANVSVLAYMCMRRICRTLDALERNCPAKHIPIDEAELSLRAYHICRDAGIEYLSEVSHMPRAELMGLRNCGTKTLRELDEACERNGLAPPSSAKSFRDDLLAVLDILGGY